MGTAVAGGNAIERRAGRPAGGEERGASGEAPALETGGRVRWRMGLEARTLLLLVAALLAFGLAVLYSASAIVAMQEGKGSMFYMLRQLTGVGVGAVVFALFAKIDAQRFERWAWPLM